MLGDYNRSEREENWMEDWSERGRRSDGFGKTLRRECSTEPKGLVCLGKESLSDGKSGCAAQARGALGR